MAKWKSSKYPGVRFREHPTRKHGVSFDKYFAIRYQRDGKRKEEGLGWTSGGWTLQKAALKLAELKEAAVTGNGETRLSEKREKARIKKIEIQKEKARKEKDAITIKNYFYKTYYPAIQQEKKHKTHIREESLFRTWINPAIGHKTFKDISSFDLERLRKNMLDEGRAPRSVQYCFATFRQIWNHARINGLINNESPTRNVKLPKVENQRLRFLSHEEAEILLKSLKIKSQKIHDMTLLSLHTGVRAGEIFSLTWGVIDLENGFALVRDAKGKPRHVYLTDATQAMFERIYEGQSPSELVFKDTNGKQIQFISHTFDRTVKELGFNDGVTDRRDKVTFHTCRHTFASWHVQNGTDLYTVKNLLGHSTIQLTERYSHLRPDGLKKAAQNFDEKVIKNNIAPLEKTKMADNTSLG
ncbi:tyrosine-type recombinase/integrase [Desulfobacula toluolica]|uniref:Integrase family protein n=1 Tax=Desulfobacula toluolica (strain DSM 7467 / Tol2) TaxID=651182 RepID=K0N7Y3_DESTT|nr:site-specific integrase [Desulfobacula toluolica]CCK80034.1 integrase family protein [Desulfobacula toluolica Tol2]